MVNMIAYSSKNGGSSRRKGYDGLTDYLLPIAKDVLSGKSHIDAFKRRSDHLGVTTRTARDRCTRGQRISTAGFLMLVRSGRHQVVQWLKQRYPDRGGEIDRALVGSTRIMGSSQYEQGSSRKRRERRQSAFELYDKLMEAGELAAREIAGLHEGDDPVIDELCRVAADIEYRRSEASSLMDEDVVEE
jgi:hypothetical protein